MVILINRAGGLIGKTVTTQFAPLDPAQPATRTILSTRLADRPRVRRRRGSGLLSDRDRQPDRRLGHPPGDFCGVAGFKPSYRLFPTVGMNASRGTSIQPGCLQHRARCCIRRRRDRRSRPPDRWTTAFIAADRRLARHTHGTAASDDMMRHWTSAPRAAASDQCARPRYGRSLRCLPTPSAPTVSSRLMKRRARSLRIRALLATASPRASRTRSTRPRHDADAYDDARRTASQARRRYRSVADGEVILSPSAPGAAPKGLGSTGEPTFNRLWTLLGTPCVNVPGLSTRRPAARHADRGAFGQDRFALSVAALLERAIARSDCG